MAITDWLPDPNKRQRGFPAPPTPTPQPSGEFSEEQLQNILKNAGISIPTPTPTPTPTPVPTPTPPSTPTPQPSGEFSEEQLQNILKNAGISMPPTAPVTAPSTRRAIPTAMPQPVLPPGTPVSRQGGPRSAGQPSAFPSRQTPGDFLKAEWSDVFTPATPGSAMDKPGLYQLEQIWDLIDAGLIMPYEAFIAEPMAQAGQAAPGAEGYAGRAQAFRERPASEQILYGLLDPSFALGSIGTGARAAKAAAPSVIKNFRTWQKQIVEAAKAKRAMEESGRIGTLFNRPSARGRPLAGLVEAEQATPRMGGPTTRLDRMLPAPAARPHPGVPVEEGRLSGVDQFGAPTRMESPVPAQESIQKIVISRNNPKGEIVTFRSNNAVQTALRQGDNTNNIILDLGASSEEINSARQTLAAGERGSRTFDISRADTEIRDNLAELRTLRGRSRTQGRSTDPSELRRDLLLDRNEHLQSQITRANARAMDIEPDTIQDIGPSREILQEEIEQSRNLFDKEYGTLDIDQRLTLRRSLPPDIQARIRRLREEDELSRLRPPDVEPGAIDDADNIFDILRPGDIISREPLQELAYITRARGADDPILGTVLGPTSEVPRASTLTEGRTTEIQLPGTGRQIEGTPDEVARLREEVRQEADIVASGEDITSGAPITSARPDDVIPPISRMASVVTPNEAPQAVGNRFVGSLRSDINEISGEVKTSDNMLVRAIFGRTGINPSILRNTWAGKLVVAYARQRVAAEQLTSSALSAGLDFHASKITNRLPLRINPDSTWADTGVPWNDVFSNPQNYKLSPQEKAYIDDYLTIIKEAEAYRIENGLTPMPRNKEGWFYVPRQVREAQGVSFTKPSASRLERVYEEAKEGFENGVKYSDDPRSTLEIHLRATYKEVIDKQLSEQTSIRSITPRQLLEAINPGVIKRYDDTRIRGLEIANELLQLRRNLRVLQIGGRETGAVGKAAQTLRTARRPEQLALQRQINQLTQEFESLKIKNRDAKKDYQLKLASAKEAEKAPSRLFGSNQPDEMIGIGTWRNQWNIPSGRFLPKEEADALTEGIKKLTEGRPSNIVYKTFGTVGDLLRFTGSVTDFGLPFIHGQPLLAENPIKWGKMLLRHEQAFFNPRIQAQLMRDHLATYQEMASYGVPIGDPEFFRAAEAGQGFKFTAPINWIPENADIKGFAAGKASRKLQRGLRATGRQTIGRFQASYNTGLGYSRVLLWEAKAPTWTGTKPELAAHIQSMTGGLDSRALGSGPNQRAIESTWLAFSPRLLRSTIALGADAMRPTTPRGQAALKNLAKWATGVTTFYVVTGMAMGKSWEEIGTGLNPLAGKRFLSHEINGQHYGVGGQIRAIAQAIGSLASTIAPGGKPIEDLARVSYYDNPIMQFWASRGNPGLNVGGAIAEAAFGGPAGGDIIPYERVDDVPDLVKHLGTSGYPFALSAYIDSGQTSEERSLTAAGVEFGAGLRTSPVTKRDQLESWIREQSAPQGGFNQFMYGLTTPVGAQRDKDERRNDLAQEVYQTDYKDLPIKGTRRQHIRDREEYERSGANIWRERFADQQRKLRSQKLEETRQSAFDQQVQGLRR
jgi:hypothetical protein